VGHFLYASKSGLYKGVTPINVPQRGGVPPFVPPPRGEAHFLRGLYGGSVGPPKKEGGHKTPL